MYRSTRRAPSRLRRFLVGAVGVAVVGATLTSLAVATDTFGAGRCGCACEPRGAIHGGTCAGSTDHRDGQGHRAAAGNRGADPAPTATPATPKPGERLTDARPDTDSEAQAKPKPVDVDVVRDPNKVFAHEMPDWVRPGGVQMVLASLGTVNTSDATQREMRRTGPSVGAYSDSHNGEWGPAAMALALDAYGAVTRCGRSRP